MMTVKVFSDDLLNALRNDLQASVPMFEDSICQSYSSNVSVYFTRHLEIKINGRDVSYTLTNCRSMGGSHWLSFAIDAPHDWLEIGITADYFLELFPTQSNVLTLHANGEKWTSRFNQKNPAQEFRINR